MLLQVKIDFKVDTASTNYDAFKGKMLAEVADGNKSSTNSKAEHPSFTSGRMDKVSFVSSINVENPRYALGMMIDKELHLVPVKSELFRFFRPPANCLTKYLSLVAFFQMRQSYSYFDKGDKRTKAEQKAENGSDDEAEDLKQVTVKFARSGDADKIKKARERSYHYISHIGADEPWCEAMIYPKHTSQSAIERQKIPLAQHAIDGHFSSIPPNEYFSDLISDNATLNATASQAPEVNEEEKEVKTPTVRGPISKKQVKKLPLLEQIKIFLKDGKSKAWKFIVSRDCNPFCFVAKILSFPHLMEMLSDSQLSIDKVLRNLALCGVMMRGNWTLQSEILYPPSFVSLTNGVSSELMCRGRDYVLFKLMRNEMAFLNRHKISAVTMLPVEETKEIIESVAIVKSSDKGKIWDLLKPPDHDFEKRHPEIVQRQDAFWKAQEEKFLEMEAEKNEKRTRKKSHRDSKT